MARVRSAHAPSYTDPSWVDFPGASITHLEGDHRVASGVQLLSTPGHTPGHQSVLIDDDHRSILLAAQAAYTARDFAADEIGERNMATEDEAIWRASLRRLHELPPQITCFSHDTMEWRPPHP